MTIDRAQILPHFQADTPADDTAPVFAIGSKDAPVVRTFLGDLVLTYVVRDPDAIVYVRERDVGPEGIEALHALAVDNLRALALASLDLRAEGKVFRVVLGKHLDASVLLLDEYWDEIAPAKVGGPLALAIPAARTVAIADASSPAAMTELRALLARSFAEDDHPLSDAIFKRRAGAWLAE